MKSSFCFAVIVVTFGLSTQMNLVVADDDDLSLADCYDYQYKLNNGNQCIDCPACPAGQEYTDHCGYEETNKRITKPRKSCKDCRPGQFKSSASPYECNKCKRKCPEGTKMIHPCNKTHDMKCSKCEKGFYTSPDGSCVRCSPCCGVSSAYANQFVQKECKDAGMLSCSCVPLQNCVDRTGDCRKGFLKLSTGNPSRKTSPLPTITNTTRKPQKCGKGFYTAPNGSCVQCSFCCGKRSAQLVEKECQDAGMGQCSCHSLKGCVDNNGACTRSTPATITTGSQRRQPNRKTSKHFKQNQKLSGGENNKQECRNKVILRQLRKILSKYKRRVIVKISVELKDRKQRRTKRKGRDLSSFRQRRMTSRDQRRYIERATKTGEFQ